MPISYPCSVRETKDLEPLIEQLNTARVVMLGEASHGTHEFYEWRRIISEWLIVKHDFNFIAVEGDWPDCQLIHNYVTRQSHKHLPSGNAAKVLGEFRRWPTWLWANAEVVRLAEWMKSHNERVSSDKQISFHGLDVYSLFESIDTIVMLLEKTNPFLAAKIMRHYSCFDRCQKDEKKFVRSLFEFPDRYKDEAAKGLNEVLKIKVNPSSNDLLNLEQNARIVKNAENYYRAMIHGNEDSWNLRDQHMMDTLDRLLQHHEKQRNKPAKGIVWAHNSHIGDFHATSMLNEGLVNLGGLARMRYGANQVQLLGFGTYEGEVIASHAWDGPVQKLPVPPAKPGSYEELLHQKANEHGCNQFFLQFSESPTVRAHSSYSEKKGHRAIGVVYDPRSEKLGNYVPSILSERYDSFFFVDKTTALNPLILPFDQTEIPETWSSGR